MLKEQVQALEATLTEHATETLQVIDENYFDEDARKTLAKMAKAVGVDYSLVNYTFSITVKDEEHKYFNGPMVVNKDDGLYVQWGGQAFELILIEAEDTEVYLTVGEGGKKCEVSIEVDYDYTLGLRCLLKPDTAVPMSLPSKFNKKPAILLPFLRTNIENKNLSEAPSTFVIKSLNKFSNKFGGTSVVLVTDKGNFWGPKGDYDVIDFPADAEFADNKLIIKNSDGTVYTYENTSFGKLKDLELGDYKVTGCKWTVHQEYGKRAQVLINNRWYTANQAIEKVLTAYDDMDVSENRPATLTIDKKTEMKDGKVRVACRFSPPKDFANTNYLKIMDMMAGNTKKQQVVENLPF
jgi:hypothetical protein